MQRARLTAIVIGLLTVACENRSPLVPDAAAIPWQPHGLRVPAAHCEWDGPQGWARSPSPMPDHIAELAAGGLRSSILIAERVEPDVATARDAALAFYRARGLTPVAEGPLVGSHSRVVLTTHRTKPNEGDVETLFLLTFAGAPIIEVLARYPEADVGAHAAVVALVQSLRCTH